MVYCSAVCKAVNGIHFVRNLMGDHFVRNLMS